MTNQGAPDPLKARYFAEVAHSGQAYAEELPYSVHLALVVSVAEKFGIREPAFVCACWLHDTLEDTRKSYNDIKDRFGEETAELVFAVTNEMGRTRKERNEKTYPKLKSNPTALLLKLCDRIANVEYGRANNGKWEMYKKEWGDFAGALYRPNTSDTLDTMWGYLASLLGVELPVVEVNCKMCDVRGGIA